MKLTKKNYFSKEASLHYMSNSQYKSFVECEAQAMADLSGSWKRKESKAMLQGSYVHAWNEGELEEFKEDHPQIFTVKGDKLRAEFVKCNEIIEIIKKDPAFMLALSGQKEVIITAEMFGTPWKIAIDSYFPDKQRFGDLKVIKAIRDRFFCEREMRYKNVFENYGYLTQMAVYAEIERLSQGRENYFEPFIAAISKEDVPYKEIVSFISEEESVSQFVANQLATVEENMPRVLSVKSGEEEPIRCEKCPYCASTHMIKSTTHYSAFTV